MSRSESDADETDRDVDTVDQLRADIAVLTEENTRLRNEYARARQTSYRRTAQGLGLVGSLSIGAALAFPRYGTVLLVLGSIGVFAGVLTYYLTPERFVAAETGDRIVAALDESLRGVATQLELADQRLYLPVTGQYSTRLYIPVAPIEDLREARMPDEDDLASPFVTDETGARGLSLVPAGGELYEELDRVSAPEDQSTATRLDALVEALVERFELAEQGDTDIDTTNGQATVRIEGAVYGGARRFEDPLASFLAVGLAQYLDQPVSQECSERDEDRLVLLEWTPKE